VSQANEALDHGRINVAMHVRCGRLGNGVSRCAVGCGR
jgi:hypothetical protein